MTLPSAAFEAHLLAWRSGIVHTLCLFMMTVIKLSARVLLWEGNPTKRRYRADLLFCPVSRD
jgi:hypothetical protein